MIQDHVQVLRTFLRTIYVSPVIYRQRLDLHVSFSDPFVESGFCYIYIGDSNHLLNNCVATA